MEGSRSLPSNWWIETYPLSLTLATTVFDVPRSIPMLTMDTLYPLLRVYSGSSMLLMLVAVPLLLQQSAQLLDARYHLGGTSSTSAHETDDGPLRGIDERASAGTAVEASADLEELRFIPHIAADMDPDDEGILTRFPILITHRQQLARRAHVPALPERQRLVPRYGFGGQMEKRRVRLLIDCDNFSF